MCLKMRYKRSVHNRIGRDGWGRTITAGVKVPRATIALRPYKIVGCSSNSIYHSCYLTAPSTHGVIFLVSEPYELRGTNFALGQLTAHTYPL